MTTTDATAVGVGLESAALERARDLARAIGDCAAFREFEATQEALDRDTELSTRLAAFQARGQELRASRAWGGAKPGDERALEREWQDLASQPALAAHLRAREELLALLHEVAGAISEGVGLDFGDACAPAGGCC